MSDLDLLQDLIDRAKRAGADAADAGVSAGASLSVQRRAGRTEHLERSESRDLGLRVFIGKQVASVSAGSVDPGQFDDLVARAVAMAKVVPEDIYAGLAEDAAIPPPELDLDLMDPFAPSTELLLARAQEAEDAAKSVAGVTNTEGAEAGWSRSEHLLVTSAGFVGHSETTHHSISATALAGSGTDMQRDYDYSTTVYFTDQESPADIGRRAGARAVARLHPRRPQTARIPVIYDNRTSPGLIGHLLGAINGASIARGTSFLKEDLHAQLFAPTISILEDPHRRRGLRSRPFDGEGVATTRRAIIDQGVLTTWLMDSRSARQLGLRTTGHARGTGNLYLTVGDQTLAELMSDISEGLYITELIGSSINQLTGDYSRGAAGFMIRGGALAEPVAELTVAGNLRDMFRVLVPADDLTLKHGTDAPSVRIEGLTVAGA